MQNHCHWQLTESMQKIISRLSQSTSDIILEVKIQNCVLNNAIEPFPDLKSLEPFCVSYYWCNSESVNVFQVIGTAHPDYIGATWIDMLKLGKRMSLNLGLLAQNPIYYFESKKKEPDMNYTKINDKIYISREGNHRTAIAKALFYYTGDTVLHGIDFQEYKIDFSLKENFEKLKKLLFAKFPYIEAKIERKTVKREDTAGWFKEYYEITISLINHKKNKTHSIKPSVLNTVLQKLNSLNFWKRLFSRMPDLPFL